jgi:hypothetical protein
LNFPKTVNIKYKIDNIHDIASLYKLFFRRLPEPLIPSNLFDDFIELNLLNDRSKQITEYKKLFKKISINNLQVYIQLMEFLQLVAEHQSENKMGVENLSVVFGVNILRSKTIDAIKIQSELSKIQKCFCILIEEFPKYLEKEEISN